MKKMKKMKYKIVTIMLSLITFATTVLPASAVYAADDITAILVQDGISGQYAGQDEIPQVRGYYQGDLTLEESQKHLCFWIFSKNGEYMNLSPVYDNSIDWNKDFYWNVVYSDHSSTSSCLMTNQYSGSLKYYIFNTKEEAAAYLATGDSSGAANLEDLILDTGEYDENLPYYDIASIDPIDADKFAMEFNSSMRSTRVKELYNLRDEGYNLYYTFESYGIYMDTDVWTNLSRIFETVGITSSFTKKVQESITIDSSGKLVVGKAHSGGGGRYINSLFQVKGLDTNIYAVEMDGTVTTQDRLTAGQSYDKTLSGDTYNGTSAVNLLFNVQESRTLQLIGYYAVIQPYIVKDGQIIYAKPTFAYNWTYKCLRDALGSGAYNYDPTDPDIPVDPVDPTPHDPDPDDPDPDIDIDDPSSLNVLTYLKKCFKEAKSFIVLFNLVILHVPISIWTVIYVALAVNLFMMVFKIVRGM